MYKKTIGGITNKERICTPKDIPTTKLISNNQRLPCGVSISASQRKPNQNNKAVNSIDIAYTSASTAENQKLSEKVKASAPTNPLARIA